jgi:hypothetical protein
MVSMNAASAVALAGTGAWPVIAGLNGPGRLDPYNPAAALIFETAAGGLRGDALARFFDSELGGLDWLTDYMMSTEVFENDQDTGPSFAVEAEPEEEYEKKALTTIDSDSGWDIT